MKSLNENWFAITLVAVIFGLLGYLIGKTSGKHHQDKNLHKVLMKDLKAKMPLFGNQIWLSFLTTLM